MEEGRFRKLNVDLQLEPITNDRPWLIAGLLLAFVLVMIAAYAFFQYKPVF